MVIFLFFPSPKGLPRLQDRVAPCHARSIIGTTDAPSRGEPAEPDTPPGLARKSVVRKFCSVRFIVKD